MYMPILFRINNGKMRFADKELILPSPVTATVTVIGATKTVVGNYTIFTFTTSSINGTVSGAIKITGTSAYDILAVAGGGSTPNNMSGGGGGGGVLQTSFTATDTIVLSVGSGGQTNANGETGYNTTVNFKNNVTNNMTLYGGGRGQGWSTGATNGGNGGGGAATTGVVGQGYGGSSGAQGGGGGSGGPPLDNNSMNGNPGVRTSTALLRIYTAFPNYYWGGGGGGGSTSGVGNGGLGGGGGGSFGTTIGTGGGSALNSGQPGINDGTGGAGGANTGGGGGGTRAGTGGIGGSGTVIVGFASNTNTFVTDGSVITVTGSDGTAYTNGTRTYFMFRSTTAVKSVKIAGSGSVTVQVLAVGGGAAGSSGGNGGTAGGGGGGVVDCSFTLAGSNTITVGVGAGGPANTGSTTANGINTTVTFLTTPSSGIIKVPAGGTAAFTGNITAYGGGCGGRYSGIPGASGGSGGGAYGGGTPGTAAYTASPNYNFGYDGSGGYGSVAGGGGGAGGKPTDAGAGIGYQSLITVPSYYWAGGGGGISHDATVALSYPSGGLGGGGAGFISGTISTPGGGSALNPGGNSTAGGGGSGGDNTGGGGGCYGAGGSGIVIMSFNTGSNIFNVSILPTATWYLAFDTSLLNLVNGVTPSNTGAGSIATIDTTIKKVGAGSVKQGNNSSLLYGNVPANVNGYSFAFWLYSTSSGPNSQIFSFYTSSSSASNRLFCFILPSNILRVTFNATNWDTPYNVPLNTWIHVVIVQTTGGAVTLYINGGTSNGGIQYTNAMSYVSLAYGACGLFYDGPYGLLSTGTLNVDAFRYFDGVLNQSQIDYLYTEK